MLFNDRYAAQAQGLLRIIAALLFIEHGTSKLFNFPVFPMPDLPPVGSIYWIGALLEAIGGVMVLLGILTRPVAFLLSGEMVVAYWMAHAPQSTFPANNGGDAAILFCFVFLFLAAAGPGAFALGERKPVVRTDDELA